MDLTARIAQAKEKAEAEYQEKIKQSREADVDVRDFFSDEELDRILTDNEFSAEGLPIYRRCSGMRKYPWPHGG